MAGKCATCIKTLNLNSRSEGALQCPICENMFHATCAGISDSKTMKFILSSKNIKWTCDSCLDKDVSVLINEVKMLRELLAEQTLLLKEHDSVLKKLISVPNVSIGTPKTPKRSYANVCQDVFSINSDPASKKKKSSTPRTINFDIPPVIIVQPKESAMENDELVGDKIKDKLDPNIDPVTDIKLTKSGKTIVICKNSAAVQSVKQKIVTHFGSNCDVTVPRGREKIIKLIGNINKEMDESEIINRIIKQNDCVPDTANIEIMSRIDREKYSSLRIKTDETTFTNLIDAGRVKILWSSCKVYEDIRVLICNKCSRFDHKEESCLSGVEICSRCAGKHKSSVCTESSFKCINCVERNSKLSMDQSTDHPAYSFRCPMLCRKHERMQKRVFYTK